MFAESRYPARMGTRRVGSYWGYVLLAAGAIGCTSTKDRCKSLCELDKNCVNTAIACSDAEIDECVDQYKGFSDDCQDAFDDFTDCSEENDNKCTIITNECPTEAQKFVNECKEEI